MKVALIEDEPLVARRLERFCREVLGAGLEKLHAATSFDQASAWLAENPVDVVLLDLNLDGQDGMELLKRSVASSFHTIIVSANTDRALEAFEFGVLDFVPKPFTRDRLAQAFARVRGPVARSGSATRNLAVRKAGRIELVAVDQVLFVQGAGNYSELVLADGRRELHDKTLEKLEALLPEGFERTHKSYLVRRDAIKALHASEGSHYELELKNGTCLPVGRTRYKELRERLTGE
ncbi:MAG TPA: LytTR family DNA-binding domain-containing protein [Lacunisphaera sp.]|nr:LytTR family DNA-binding domain-containing protein [Lacunisphaera sp.]